MGRKQLFQYSALSILPPEFWQDSGTQGRKDLVRIADTYLIVLPLGLLCQAGIKAFTDTDATIYLPTLTISAVFIVFLWKRNPQARDTLAAPQEGQTEVAI